MNAKQQFLKDISNFIDEFEFADTHDLNGKETKAIIDTDNSLFSSVNSEKFEGMWEVSKIIYVETKFFEGVLPVPNSMLSVDDELHHVISCEDQEGITKLILRGDES